MKTMRIWAIAIVVAMAGIIFGNQQAAADAICGGVAKSGKLTAPCSWTAAKQIGRPKSSCPADSFADIGEATYGCWRCPATFARGTAAVNTDEACFKFAGSKPVFSDYKPAKRLAAYNTCPAGSFFDPRNKGECWSCPAGFGRNMNAVNDSKSCSRLNIDLTKTQIIEYRAATFVSAACGEKGGFWDPINGGSCWQCPTGYERTVLPAVTSGQACGRRLVDYKPATKISGFGCKATDMRGFWDPINGGSCWVCPAGSQRTTAPVNSPQACQPNAFQWKAAEFFNPGLFGFDGAAEVALKLIAQRTAIEAAAVAQGAKAGISEAEARRQVWEDIKTDPTQNLPLVTAVLEHILDMALGTGAPAGSPEARLIAAFQKYILNRRIFAAQEALKAYDNWAKAQALILSERQKNQGAFGGAPAMLGLFSDQTPMPPDFTQQVAGAILTGTAMSAPVMAGFAANIVLRPDGNSPAMLLAKKIFVNRTKTVAVGFDEFETIGKTVVKTAKDAAKSGLKFSLSNLKLGSALLTSVGPQVVAQIATMVLQAELEKNLTKADARPKLERLLVKARTETVDLKRISQQQDRAGEIHTFWSMAVSGNIAPNSQTLSAIRKTIEKVQNPHAFDPSLARWYAMPGTADALGAGASGDIWHVGGGGSLYVANAQNDGRWRKVAGSGVVQVAAMDTPGMAFLLMTDGSMRRIADGKMTRIDGKASAIAYGGGVMWHIGGNNSIYRSTGGAWQRVNGSAKRIAAVPGGGALAVGTDDKIYLFDGASWTNLPGTARDVAVGPDGVSWYVDPAYTLHRMTGLRAWKKFSAGNIANIAAGPDGSLLARRSNGQIVAYSPFRPAMAQAGSVTDTTTTKDAGDGITVTMVIVGEPTTTTYGSSKTKKPAAKSWRPVPGIASDISVSASGDVWHIGGSGSVYVMSGGKGNWKQMLDKGAVRVAALPSAGKAFILMRTGAMREIDNGRWRDIPGKASDIAVSPDGRKWHIGGGGSVYREAPTGWQRQDGTIARIAGAKSDRAWAVGTNKRIYFFQAGKWSPIAGEAKDVVVGADGSVWHIGMSDTIYRLVSGNKWEGVDAQGKVAALSVGDDGEIWIVRPDGAMAAYR